MSFITDNLIALVMVVMAVATIAGAIAATPAMVPISRGIDALSVAVGKSVMWLVLVAVLVSAYNAMQRYAFNVSSNAWLEIQWYLYGAIFLGAAAYTLQRNEHIRIDVVASMLSRRTRAKIDLFGHIFFLLPLTILIVEIAVPWAIFSFQRNELSENAGGLIRWPAKSLVVIGFALLFLQGLSEIVKRIAVLRGVIDDPYAENDAADALVEGVKAMALDDASDGAPVGDVDDRKPGGRPRADAAPGGRS